MKRFPLFTLLAMLVALCCGNSCSAGVTTGSGSTQSVFLAQYNSATLNLTSGTFEQLQLDHHGYLYIDCPSCPAVPTGTSGYPNSSVITVQGISGMTPVLVNLAGAGATVGSPLFAQVTNFPSSFSISNFPATQNVALTGLGATSGTPLYANVTDFPTSFQVSNFPATTSVSNFPSSFSVSNFPATFGITGALPAGTNVLGHVIVDSCGACGGGSSGSFGITNVAQANNCATDGLQCQLAVNNKGDLYVSMASSVSLAAGSAVIGHVIVDSCGACGGGSANVCATGGTPFHINLTASGDTPIVVGTAGKTTYICNMSIVSNVSGTSFALDQSASSSCTSPATIWGTINVTQTYTNNQASVGSVLTLGSSANTLCGNLGTAVSGLGVMVSGQYVQV